MDLGITGAEDTKTAADALKLFQDRVSDASDELQGMQKALRLLKGDSVGNAASITALKDKITAQKAVVASSAAQVLKLGGNFKKAKPDTEQLSKAFALMKGELSGAGGALGGVAGGLGKVASAATAAGPLGLVALALAAISVAALAAAGALTVYGLAAADTRRSEALQLEGLTKLRFGYGLLGMGYQMAADKASFLQETIDRVSGTVSIGRDRVAQYTEQLYKMGMRSGNLRAAVEGISIAASAQGEAGAQQFLYMASTARFAGVSMQKLADDTKARLGGIVARQMLSLDVQTKKLKENFAFLFSGVRIEGFLAGLNKVTELFSANTESGKALKEIITTIFSPFFDLSGDAGEVFANFIKGAELAALNLLISLYPVRKWLHETFGDVSIAKNMEIINTAIWLGGLAFNALEASLAPITGLIAAVFVGLMLIGTTLVGLHKIIADTDWVQGGIDIAKGIAKGIAQGATWVLDAIGNLGAAAITKFKSVFDMHSPSRLMRREGVNIPRGIEQGIDDGVPDVQRAVARALPDLDSPSAVRDGAAKATAKSAAGGSAQPLIGVLELHTNEKTTVEQAKDFASQLVAALRGAGVQMGAVTV